MKKKETFCPGCHTRDKRAPPFVPDRRSRLGNRDNSGFPTGTNQRFCSSACRSSSVTNSRPIDEEANEEPLATVAVLHIDEDPI